MCIKKYIIFTFMILFLLPTLAGAEEQNADISKAIDPVAE